MTHKEASDLQAAYVAGYILETDEARADLKKAEGITGKRAIVKKFKSTANPLASVEIRTLGGKRD